MIPKTINMFLINELVIAYKLRLIHFIFWELFVWSWPIIFHGEYWRKIFKHQLSKPPLIIPIFSTLHNNPARLSRQLQTTSIVTTPISRQYHTEPKFLRQLRTPSGITRQLHSLLHTISRLSSQLHNQIDLTSMRKHHFVNI